MLPSHDFFDLKDYENKGIFVDGEAVWTALDRLKDYLASFFNESWPLAGMRGQIDTPLAIFNGEVLRGLEVKATGPKGSLQAYKDGRLLEGAAIVMPGAFFLDDNVQVGSGTVVEPGALIRGPIVIGKNSEIRHGAYVRGDCLVGNKCVIGHTTEIKGSIMLDGAKAGHFAYIGDSILGMGVNLGAGTKLANLMAIPGTVVIRCGKKRYDTGRRKIGAILGDGTETGCNSVTSPGTLMGPRSVIYPAMAVPGGYYPEKTIVSPGKNVLKIQNLNL